jgi:hypothetical protein
MSHPSISRELQPLIKPQGRRVGSAVKLRSSFVAAIKNPDILLVIAFSLIGLLLTITFILRFPDLGALIVQYNQF